MQQCMVVILSGSHQSAMDNPHKPYAEAKYQQKDALVPGLAPPSPKGP